MRKGNSPIQMTPVNQYISILKTQLFVCLSRIDNKYHMLYVLVILEKSFKFHTSFSNPNYTVFLMMTVYYHYQYVAADIKVLKYRASLYVDGL